MRRQAVLLGALAALGMAGSLPSVGSIPSPIAVAGASTSVPGVSALAAALAATSRRSFFGMLGGGVGGFFGLQPVNGWRKRPHGSVARDKRDARKKRNQLRNKR